METVVLENGKMKPIKSKILLIALATSFCLVGTAACGSSSDTSNPNDTPEMTDSVNSAEGAPETEASASEASEPMILESEALKAELGKTNINAEIAEVKRTHETYLDSIQENLLKPLDIIASQSAEERTRQFVDETGINVAQVNMDLQALAVAVQNALAKVTQIKAERQEESPQLSSLDQGLADLQKKAEEVKMILQPLTPAPPAKPEDIFISASIDSDNEALTVEQQKSAISILQSTIGLMVGDDYVGQYGQQTSDGVRNFVEGQNKITMEQVENIVSAISLPDNPSETVVPWMITWSAGAALLFAILNTLAIVWILALLQKQRKWLEQFEQAATGNNFGRTSSQSNDTRLATAVRKLEQQVDEILAQQNALTASRQSSQITPTTASTPSFSASPTPRSPAHSASIYGQAPAYEDTQTSDSSQPSSAPRTNQGPQDISSLPRIATVKMTQKSQEEIWVGKNVAAVFSPSSQGDYWIVSPDNQRYYIILKDKAILNANNLKTLKILYDFVDQPKLSALKRHYDVPAEVKSSGSNEWELVSSGKLTFLLNSSV